MASAQLHVVVVLLFGVVIFAGAVMCECHDNLLKTGRFGGEVVYITKLESLLRAMGPRIPVGELLRPFMR